MSELFKMKLQPWFGVEIDVEAQYVWIVFKQFLMLRSLNFIISVQIFSKLQPIFKLFSSLKVEVEVAAKAQVEAKAEAKAKTKAKTTAKAKAKANAKAKTKAKCLTPNA